MTLTKTEAEILEMLTVQLLTIRQIKSRRGCSHQAIYKVIKRLRNQGLLTPLNMKVAGCESAADHTLQPLNTMQPKKPLLLQPSHPSTSFGTTGGHDIRLHGQMWQVRILFKDHKYADAKAKGNMILLDGNKVELHDRTLLVYSGKDFWAESAKEAERISLDYWMRFFVRLENLLGIMILKDRSCNLRLVKWHFGEAGNELAKDCNKDGSKIRVFAPEDGKLWFVIDNSFNLNEAETQHKDSAAQDMDDVIKPFFNDLRSNKPMMLSDLQRILGEVASLNKETAAGLTSVVQIMVSQLPKKEEEIKGVREKPEYVG